MGGFEIKRYCLIRPYISKKNTLCGMLKEDRGFLKKVDELSIKIGKGNYLVNLLLSKIMYEPKFVAPGKNTPLFLSLFFQSSISPLSVNLPVGLLL